MEIIEAVMRNVEEKVWESIEWGDSEYVKEKAREIVVSQLTELVVKGHWG